MRASLVQPQFQPPPVMQAPPQPQPIQPDLLKMKIAPILLSVKASDVSYMTNQELPCTARVLDSNDPQLRNAQMFVPVIFDQTPVP